MNLPETKTSIETLQSKVDAEKVLATILERKQDLEDYVAVIQPLLYTLSMKLCGEKTEMPLRELVELSIKHINSDMVTVEVKGE